MRSYYSVALPLAEGDAVLDLRLADLTGDGKREAVLRVRRAVTPCSERNLSSRALGAGGALAPTARGIASGRAPSPWPVAITESAEERRGASASA